MEYGKQKKKYVDTKKLHVDMSTCKDLCADIIFQCKFTNFVKT